MNKQEVETIKENYRLDCLRWASRLYATGDYTKDDYVFVTKMFSKDDKE